MEVLMPVPGVSEDNLQHWIKIIENFTKHRHVPRAVSELKKFFKKQNFIGYLVSLSILKHNLETVKATVSDELIELALYVKKIAQELFKQIKQQTKTSSIKYIFQECKNRLLLILEVECGCGACVYVVKSLNMHICSQALPKLNPHKDRCHVNSFLRGIHNLIKLNIPPQLNLDHLNQLSSDPTDFFDFSADLQHEVAALITCMHYCWLYISLHEFLIKDFIEIQSHITKTIKHVFPDTSSDVNITNFFKELIHSSKYKDDYKHNMPMPCTLPYTEKVLSNKLNSDNSQRNPTIENIITSLSHKFNPNINSLNVSYIDKREAESEDIPVEQCISSPLKKEAETGNIPIEQCLSSTPKQTYSCHHQEDTTLEELLSDVMVEDSIVRKNPKGLFISSSNLNKYCKNVPDEFKLDTSDSEDDLDDHLYNPHVKPEKVLGAYKNNDDSDLNYLSLEEFESMLYDEPFNKSQHEDILYCPKQKEKNVDEMCMSDDESEPEAPSKSLYFREHV